MLGPGDVLELPRGVEARAGRLADDVRGVSIPLNPAAALVVARSGRALAEIAGDLGAAFALPPRRAHDDVLAFAWQLNRLGLANVRRGSGRLAAAFAWLVLAVRLLPAGTVPPAAVRRVPLDTRRAWAAALGVLRALAPRAAGLGAVVAVAVLPPASVTDRGPVVAGVLGVGTAVALVLHEAGHAALLAGASPAALLLGWRRVSVLHGPLPERRAQVVAAAGPLAACLAGLAVAVTAAAWRLPELAIGGLPLAGHAVGLLALTNDGRKACGT